VWQGLSHIGLMVGIMP